MLQNNINCNDKVMIASLVVSDNSSTVHTYSSSRGDIEGSLEIVRNDMKECTITKIIKSNIDVYSKRHIPV